MTQILSFNGVNLQKLPHHLSNFDINNNKFIDNEA